MDTPNTLSTIEYKLQQKSGDSQQLELVKTVKIVSYYVGNGDWIMIRFQMLL